MPPSASPRPSTAVFGGSFNPPHVGHAMVAAWLQWTGKCDAVWFVPAYEHAFGKDLAPWPRRLDAVCALADLLNGPLPNAIRWAGVSDIELSLSRPSYTIHTLDALRDRHPDRAFRLVVGADVWAQMPMWRHHERVVAEFSPIVVGRTGYPPAPGTPTFPAVSSTEIRDFLARGEPVDGLVPRAVLEAWRGPPYGA